MDYPLGYQLGGMFNIRASQRLTAGRFVNPTGREGEAPAEPHAREQGFLKVAAQPELRPPNRTDFLVGPTGQP